MKKMLLVLAMLVIAAPVFGEADLCFWLSNTADGSVVGDPGVYTGSDATLYLWAQLKADGPVPAISFTFTFQGIDPATAEFQVNDLHYYDEHDFTGGTGDPNVFLDTHAWSTVGFKNNPPANVAWTDEDDPYPSIPAHVGDNLEDIILIGLGIGSSPGIGLDKDELAPTIGGDPNTLGSDSDGVDKFLLGALTFDVNGPNPTVFGQVGGQGAKVSGILFDDTEVVIGESTVDGNPGDEGSVMAEVPEPTTMILLGLGVLGVLRRRR